jgi:hypothetical protein
MAKKEKFEDAIPRSLYLGGTIEKQEDNTLMGRLAERMAARDYIDSKNLGTKASKADTADAGIPKPVRIEGQALAKGTKVEMEHTGTINHIKKKPETSVKNGAKMIAKDHLKESDKYYDELEKTEKNL